MSEHEIAVGRVIAHIEANLGEALSIEQLSRVAGYSPFHFSRIFKSVTDENVMGMIKRLRAEAAARRLYNLESSITTIGLDVGYNTPSSFNKAFRQRFATSPTQFLARREKKVGHFFSPQTLSGEIVELPQRRFVSVRRVGNYYESGTGAWKTLFLMLKKHRITLDAPEGGWHVGLCYDIPEITDENRIRYEAAVEVTTFPAALPEIFSERTVPAGRYASLHVTGSFSRLYQVWPKFYGWVLTQGYRLDEHPPMGRLLDNPASMLARMPKAPTIELLLKLEG